MAKYHYAFENGDNIWVTSDLHFGHKNIIKYCNRPFDDTDEMDETIIKNWNGFVKTNDIVFILGDVGFGNPTNLINKIKRLNGKKILVIGNHDRDYLGNTEFISLFESVHEQLYVKIGENEIYMTHFPLLCFDGAYKGLNATWNLFGHCHSFPGCFGMDVQRLSCIFPTQYDVGMDNYNYCPHRFNQLKEIITEQQMSLNLVRKC